MSGYTFPKPSHIPLTHAPNLADMPGEAMWTPFKPHLRWFQHQSTLPELVSGIQLYSEKLPHEDTDLEEWGSKVVFSVKRQQRSRSVYSPFSHQVDGGPDPRRAFEQAFRAAAGGGYGAVGYGGAAGGLLGAHSSGAGGSSSSLAAAVTQVEPVYGASVESRVTLAEIIAHEAAKLVEPLKAELAELRVQLELMPGGPEMLKMKQRYEKEDYPDLPKRHKGPEAEEEEEEEEEEAEEGELKRARDEV